MTVALCLLGALAVAALGWSLWLLPSYERRVLTALTREGGPPSSVFALQVAKEARVPRGVIYLTLHLLEDEGLVESHEVPGDPVRQGFSRYAYRATPSGRAQARRRGP